MTPRRCLIWFVLSGIGGAALDLLHTHLGVLSYREPWLFGQAWWVAPNFGIGFSIFLAIGMLMTKRAIDLPTPRESELYRSGAIFAGAYLLSCFFSDHPWLMLLFFVAVFLGRAMRGPATKLFIAHALALAAMGTAFELALTSTGAYWFHHPDVLTVPAWLPGLYLNGAPFGLWLAKKLAR